MPSQGIVQQDLPLHTLGIQYLKQARCALLKTELRESQRFLRLLQEAFVEYVNQFSGRAHILIMLVDGSSEFIARPEQLGLIAAFRS